VVDARGASGVLVGDHGIQINYLPSDGATRPATDPAVQRALITRYLETLIAWLGSDPWPRDPRFGGLALTPTTIERKLSVSGSGGIRDADELARRCQRLVILGGPGSGKTWLARRIARRCAEGALAGLAAGQALDDVELPLYTTCSRLAAAAGDVRAAVISSAFFDLADLGGSEVIAAIQGLFADRNAATLLVLDSLDEAHAPDERIRQAETLPWRIILTSRRTAWRNQLTIPPTDESQQLGELQPLRYPVDVEAIIGQWFSGEPGRGQHLAAQIARRPNLQQSATVPLILALYCILGGTEPLPASRPELYIRVLKRMLTGRWRWGSDADAAVDADACLTVLRAWAWEGASRNDPVSGVGAWSDDLATGPAGLTEADALAVAHVAMPTGPADIDSGKTSRRFVHRSVREHLVAEHIASLPAEEAASILLPHLWFDSDWEYAAPAAICLHPQRDELLRSLLGQAARTGRIPADLSLIDTGWEVRRLLAQVAGESEEGQWAPATAAVIGRARVELAQAAHFRDLGASASWTESNRQIYELLLGPLRAAVVQHKSILGVELARALMFLPLAAAERLQVREAIAGLINQGLGKYEAADLVTALIGLAPAREERQHARGALLDRLRRSTWQAEALVDGVVRLAPTPEEQAEARAGLLGVLAGPTLHVAVLDGVIRLSPAGEEQRAASIAALKLLAKEWSEGPFGELMDKLIGLVELPDAADNRPEVFTALLRMLQARRTRTEFWRSLVEALARLAATPRERRRVRARLLELLARDRAGAEKLTRGLVLLAPEPREQGEVREQLLGLLATQTDSWAAATLARALAQLAPTERELRSAARRLIELLADYGSRRVDHLLDGLAELAPTADEQRLARTAMLRRIAHEQVLIPSHVADQIVRWATMPDDQRDEVRGELLVLLAVEDDSRKAEVLASAIARLTPTAGEQHDVRARLLHLLGQELKGERAAGLASMLPQLAPTAEDLQEARQAILAPIRGHSWGSRDITRVLMTLQPTLDDRSQARRGLIGLMWETYRADPEYVAKIVDLVLQLSPTAEDKQDAGELLAGAVATEQNGYKAARLAKGLNQLDPPEEQRARARNGLTTVLAGQGYGTMDGQVIYELIQLAPTEAERADARPKLLDLLAGVASGTITNLGKSRYLVDGILNMAITAEDKEQTREALVRLLQKPGRGDGADSQVCQAIADGIAYLGASANEQRVARRSLLRWIREDKYPRSGDLSSLVGSVVQLNPVIEDLDAWRPHKIAPPEDMLAAVRGNSTTDGWLTALPSLAKRFRPPKAGALPVSPKPSVPSSSNPVGAH